jgi:hypothetical protein
VIRHRANPVVPKKRNAEPRQKQRRHHPVIDPLVNPGSPPHRHQTRSKAHPARTHHRMVTLAQSSPGRRSAGAFQMHIGNCNARVRVLWHQRNRTSNI